MTSTRYPLSDRHCDKARAILDLYEGLKSRVVDWTHSQYATRSLDWLFSKPIFKSTDFISSVTIPSPTARRLLTAFKSNGLVNEISPGRGRRAAVLTFPGLLNLVEGREVF